MEALAPDSYAQFLADLKSRIQAAQIRASLSVNRELVLLYWQIGRDILERQDRERWGAKVIDRLATDLKRAFPEMRGFSPRNLKYMRRFAEVWAEEEFVQQVAAQLPWFQSCVLLDKVTNRDRRVWCGPAAIQHSRSRAVLVYQIENGLHQRAGGPSPTSVAPSRHFSRTGMSVPPLPRRQFPDGSFGPEAGRFFGR